MRKIAKERPTTTAVVELLSIWKKSRTFSMKVVPTSESTADRISSTPKASAKKKSLTIRRIQFVRGPGRSAMIRTALRALPNQPMMLNTNPIKAITPVQVSTVAFTRSSGLIAPPSPVSMSPGT